MIPGNIMLLHPGWLWWLVLLPAIAVITHYLLRKPGRLVSVNGRDQSADISADVSAGIGSGKYNLFHPLTDLIPRSHPEYGHRRKTQVLLWLVLTCLLLSLSQPVLIGKQKTEPHHGRDIVFIVDTSLSMVLRDYILNGQRVERINVLKQLLTAFVHQLQGERIAIIVFGDTAQTLVPLTRDQYLLSAMISRISAGILKRHNAVGDAITLAVHEASQDKKRNRILVLFTDAGDDTGSVTPLAAAQLAAEANLPLYTVAIGSATQQAEEQQRYSGLLYQSVDKSLLRSLSTRTGARSYQAGDSNMLQQAISDITRYGQQRPTASIQITRHDLYIWPLLLGLGLLCLLQILHLVRNRSV